MHPRYSRMIIEASKRNCVPDAALCAALVSGRDLLARNQDQQTREMFEESDDSDFITLIRAYDFAKENRFSFNRCRSHGINAQVARQIDETYKQILHSARQQGLYEKSSGHLQEDVTSASPTVISRNRGKDVSFVKALFRIRRTLSRPTSIKCPAVAPNH
jgi:HrpA-like RNA helicase